jgi:hypothetical protein
LLKRDAPKLVKENKYPMVESATWGDDIKSKGGSF